MTLDFTPLKKAISALDEAVKARTSNPDEGLYLDAAIQRFEFTYELSWKTLRRFLKEYSGLNANELKEMLFPDLIRTGNETGLLLNDWSVWKQYKDARNLTSHTYDLDIALSVYKIIPDFLEEAKYLYAQIETRQPE